MARRWCLALAIIWPALAIGCSSPHVDGTVTVTGLSATVLSVAGPPYGGPYGHGLNQVPILAATSVTNLCGLTVGLRDVAISEIPPPFPLSGASSTYHCWGTIQPAVPSVLLAIQTDTNCVNTNLRFALTAQTLTVAATTAALSCPGPGPGAGTAAFYQPDLSLVAIPLSRLPKALLTVSYDGPPAQTFVDLRPPLPPTLEVATRATEVDTAISDAARLVALSSGIGLPEYRDGRRNGHLPVVLAMANWSDPGLGCLDAAGPAAAASTPGYVMELADSVGHPPVTEFHWAGGRLVWCAGPIGSLEASSPGPGVDATTARYLAAMRTGQTSLRRAWLDGIEPALGGKTAQTRWVIPGLARLAALYLEAVSAQPVPVGLAADAQLKQALTGLIAKTSQLMAEPDARYAVDAADLWRPIASGPPSGGYLYGPTFQAVVDAETAIGSGPPRVTGLAPATGPRQGGNEVEVTGTSFQYGATVWFGDRQASASPSDAYRDDANVLYVIAPSGEPGSVGVVVRTPAGSSPSTSGSEYTYY